MNARFASAPKAFESDLNSDCSSDAGLLLTSTLSHRTIRNSVHGVQDEDDSRTGNGHAQHNLPVSRRLALNLPRRNQGAKIGIAAKRNRAGWRTDDFLKVLSQ